MTDNAFDFPDGWTGAVLQDIAEINPKLDKSRFHDELEVSFVPMPAVEAETGSIDVSETRKFIEVKKGYTAFLERDVLFAKITPCMENGKMGVVPTLKNGLGFGSTEFHVIRPYTGLVSEYIYYCVSSQRYRFDAEHNMTGAVGQRRVPTPYISKSRIPVPPTQAQHRIVAKIEELFSELDKGIESLKTAREQLKVYRQAVLKHAFEGKLTAQWREENKTKLETADQLLARIQNEREARYQQKLEEWQSAVKQWETEGKKRKRPTRPRKPKWHEPSKGSCDIPNSWIIVNCENLAHEVTDGDHQAPPKTDHGIPFITISNIDKNSFKVDFSNTFFVGTDYYDGLSRNRKAKKGDVLYTVTGSFGIPVIVDFNKDFCFQRHIGLISPVELIDTIWFFNLLRSPVVFQQAENKATGTAQKTVALSSLREFELPLCSIEEQREISEILEQQLSTIENLDRNASEQLMKSETIRQSILKKAFSGQLVEQDPNDEPASVLLERIKAEKAAQAKHHKPRRKSKPRRKEAI